MMAKNDFVVKYTNKDLMQKLDNIHKDISDLKTGQAVTNGRVKIHAKILFWMAGAILGVAGWVFTIILN